MTLFHRTRLARLVVVALAAATGLVGLSATSASAAVCNSVGISAVVDANGAGGGVSTACAKGSSAKKASAVFSAVGVEVDRNRDGSVCRVNGLPKEATCQGLGNQYWALFWSDGKKGTWVYAQQGDASLTVPKNGSVAWAWQSGSTKREPGAAPPVIKPTPKPTPKPTKKPEPTKPPAEPKPTRTTTAAAATARAEASASAKASASALAKVKATASASAGETPSGSASASAEPSATDQASPAVASAQEASSAFKPEDEHSGLPAWVPVGVIVVLGAAAGGAVWWRRRTGAA